MLWMPQRHDRHLSAIDPGRNSATELQKSSCHGGNLSKLDCLNTWRHRQAQGEEKPSLSGCCVKGGKKHNSICRAIWRHPTLLLQHTTWQPESTKLCARQQAEAVAPRQQLSSHGHKGGTEQGICVYLCVWGGWSIICPAQSLFGYPIQYAQPDCLCPTRASMEGL